MAHRDLLRSKLYNAGSDGEGRKCRKCGASCRNVLCAECYGKCKAWLYAEDQRVRRFNDGDLIHGKPDVRIEPGFRKG